MPTTSSDRRARELQLSCELGRTFHLWASRNYEWRTYGLWNRWSIKHFLPDYVIPFTGHYPQPRFSYRSYDDEKEKYEEVYVISDSATIFLAPRELEDPRTLRWPRTEVGRALVIQQKLDYKYTVIFDIMENKPGPSAHMSPKSAQEAVDTELTIAQNQLFDQAQALLNDPLWANVDGVVGYVSVGALFVWTVF